MARAPIAIYKKSPLATVASLAGTVCFILGYISMRQGQLIGGIICVLLAVGLFFLGSFINDRKMFKLWKKHIEEHGLDKAIATNTADAFQAYNANPGKMTLKYIRTLNPVAAEEISKALASNKNK